MAKSVSERLEEHKKKQREAMASGTDVSAGYNDTQRTIDMLRLSTNAGLRGDDRYKESNELNEYYANLDAYKTYMNRYGGNNSADFNNSLMSEMRNVRETSDLKTAANRIARQQGDFRRLQSTTSLDLSNSDSVENSLKSYAAAHKDPYADYKLTDYDSRISELENTLNKYKQYVGSEGRHGTEITEDQAEDLSNELANLKSRRNKYDIEHRFEKYEDVMNNADFESKSGYVKSNDGTYEYINMTPEERQKYARENTSAYSLFTQRGTANKVYSDEGYDAMTEDEISVYNYLYQQDPKQAKAYLEDMRVPWNKRQTEEMESNVQRVLDAHSGARGFVDDTLLTLASPLAGMIGAAESGTGTLVDKIAGLEYNPYSAANQTANMTNALTSGISAEVGSKTGTVGSFLYDTGTNALNSLVGGLAFGAWYTPIMGLSAAQQRGRELKDAGASTDDILSGAVASGIFEALFEYASLDKLVKIKDVDSMKRLVTESLKQAGVEGSEEIFTEIANTVYDTVARGDESDIATTYRSYLDQGMTKAEAERQIAIDFSKDVALAGFGGALSGGAMGAAAAGINMAQNNRLGRQINATESGETVQNFANRMTGQNVGGNTDEYLADLKARGIDTQNLSDTQTGMLYEKSIADAVTRGADMDAVQDLVSIDRNLARAESDNIKDRTTDKRNGKGEDLTIQSISTNAEGDTVLNTDKGMKKVSEVSLSNQDSELISYAKRLDNSQTEEFFKNYNGKAAVSDYYNAFSLAESYAESGVGEENVIKTFSNNSALPLESAVSIYRNTLLNKASVRQDAVDQIVKKFSGKYEGTGKVNDSVIDYAKGTAGGQKLTKSQKNQITIMNSFAKSFGVNLEWFASEADENGKRTAENGSYDHKTNTLRIDAFAGMNSGVTKSTIINTASHELTHWMKDKSPQLYSNLQEAVMNALQTDKEYYEDASNYDVAAYESNKYGMTMEGATDEMVARACENMLSDSSYARSLLQNMDQSQVKTFKTKVSDVLHDIAQWAKDVLKNLRSDSAEAKSIERMGKQAEKILNTWEQTLQEAIEVNKKIGNLTETYEQIGEDVVSKDAAQFSVRTWEESGRGNLEKWLDQQEDIDIATKNQILTDMQNAYELTKKYADNKEEFPDFSAWQDTGITYNEEGHPVFSVIVPNGEYEMNIDFSTVCKKRKTLDKVLINLTKSGALDTRTLAQKDIGTINRLIKEHGFEIACGLCFVDSKRYRVSQWAHSFTDGTKTKVGFNDMVESIARNMEDVGIDYYNFVAKNATSGNESLLLKDLTNEQLLEKDPHCFDVINDIMAKNNTSTAQYRMAYAIKNNQILRSLLNANDIIQSEGTGKIQAENPELNNLLKSHQGSSRPKPSFSEVAYNSDVLTDKRFTAEAAYKVGGVRVQSFSDYMGNMVFDYMQMIGDLAAKKMPSHAYTKETAFAEMYGLTGMKINMSIVPRAIEQMTIEERAKTSNDRLKKYAGLRLDENGKPVETTQYGKYGEPLAADGKSIYLIEDETFNYEDALRIRSTDGYDKNVGTIWVGISDAHIRALLNDPTVDMVIPYHRSSLNSVIAAMRNVNLYNDYTRMQNTRYNNARKTKVPATQIKYDFYESLMRLKDPKAACQEYLDYCDENGYIPKFDRFRNEENYYKLIEDFRLYDNAGTYAAQGAVTTTYPENFEQLMVKSLQSSQETSDRLNANMNALLKDIKEELGLKDNVQYSRREANPSVRKAEYEAYSNSDIEAFVKKYLAGDISWRGDSVVISDHLDADFAERIKNETGIDVSEYKNTLRASAIGHIIKDHGKNGKSDHSMKNTLEIAKIPYVINRWDDVREGKVSREYRNSDNSFAKTIVVKTLVGQDYYYIVEAVPDAKNKTLQIVSAYKNKADSLYEEPVSKSKDKDPRRYVHDDLRLGKSATNSVADNKQMSRRTESIYENVGEKEKLNKRMSLMQDEINVLRERLKLEGKVTDGKVLDRKKVQSVASMLLRENNSTMELASLRDQLYDLYSDFYKESSGDINVSDYYNEAAGIAKQILETSKGEKIVDSYAQEIVRDIKKMPFRLSEEQISEAKAILGDDYRDQLKGKVEINRNASRTLEQAWSSLQERYPEVFRSDISSAEMLPELATIYDNSKAAAVTEINYNTSENQMLLAVNMLQKMNTMNKQLTLTTTADRYQEKIRDLRKQYQSNMDALKSSFDDRLLAYRIEDGKRYAKELRQVRESRANAIKRYQKIVAARDTRITEAKEAGRQKLADYKQRQSRKAMIQKIRADLGTLDKWVEGRDKNHRVPEVMKPIVTDLISSIDLSSKRSLSGGELTQADQKFQSTLLRLRNLMETMSGRGEDTASAMYGSYPLPDSFISTADEIIKNVGSQIERISGSDVYLQNQHVLNRMSNEDLSNLKDIVKIVKQSVNNMNRALSSARSETISDLATSSMKKWDSMKQRKQANWFRDYVSYGMGLPYYVFQRFGDGGIKVRDSFMDGWDRLAFNVRDVMEFSEEAYTKKEVKSWSSTKHSFKIANNGNPIDIEMTDAQIMSLYCLVKREQARSHLSGGGIRLAKNDTIKNPYGRAFNITESELSNIIDSLSDRQKTVADELQNYMNTTGSEWGNEVTMTLYGTREFTEKNYFPIQSDKNQISSNKVSDKENFGTLNALLNQSFTKKTVNNANNAIIVGDIFDIFADHMSNMAKYNALALPVTDAVRWFNYKEKISNEDGSFTTKTTKESMERALGKGAVNYFRTFMDDINGQENVGRDAERGAKWLTNHMKTASVAANLRVASLQPTAYFRAGAVINPIYLAKAMSPDIKARALGKKTDLAEKWCGITLWKSLGYYDTDISRGVADRIKHNTSTIDNIKEKSMWLAEQGDRVTWGRLFYACELETRHNNPELKIGSEEYYKAVANRLREIVYRTQVVDSTMTRSQSMRAKNGMEQMLTAFMSEPTLSFNLLQQTILEWGDARDAYGKNSQQAHAALKKTKNAFIAYAATAFVTALAEGAFDYIRDDDSDDDEDQSAWQEYLGYFLDNLGGDLSVLQKIPVVKDMISVLQGYKNTTPYTQGVQALYYAILYTGKLGNDTYSKEHPDELTKNGEKAYPVKALRYWMQVASYLSGLGIYNGYRDATTTINRVGNLTESAGVLPEGNMMYDLELWNEWLASLDNSKEAQELLGDLQNGAIMKIVKGLQEIILGNAPSLIYRLAAPKAEKNDEK